MSAGPTRERLLRLLADGVLHSGEDLASGLGVTRAAVWKLVAELRERGIEVESLERRGYRLPRPVELLDAHVLQDEAARAGRPLQAELELLFETGSTNDDLYAAPAPPPGRSRLLFAELQRAGRGRRGRSWLAPFGSGLTFSIGWTFAETPPDLSALGLALGVQVVRALRGLGAEEVMLKWPNDVVHLHRKLGGLLIQLRYEAGGPACVVAGLGLNLYLPEESRRALATPGATEVTDLREACGGSPPGRNRVAAHVAAAMLDGLVVFERHGFAPFSEEWQSLDSLRDAAVRIVQGDTSIAGVARGADVDGALRVETEGRMARFVSGDVSLRRDA